MLIPLLSTIAADGFHIPPEVFSQATPGGLLALVVLLVLSGRLVPARQFQALERERDHWRAIAEKSTDQVEKLMAGAEVAAQVTQILAQRAIDDDAARVDASGGNAA